MKSLIFRQGKQISRKGEKPVRWSSDRGYHFKGEFLDRYKSGALLKLRLKIEEAGRKKNPKSTNPYTIGKTILKDEAEVIHNEWLKREEATQKIRETKKPYFEELKKQSIKKRIKRLKEELDILTTQNMKGGKA